MERQQYYSSSANGFVSAYGVKLVDLTGEVLKEQQIIMKPGDKFFTLKFFLLDYEKGKHQYAYMIKGVDANWNYINETSLRISDLPPGRHTLLIKAQNMDGHWNVSELKIPVIVIAPLWQRTWFRILVILFSLIAIYSLKLPHLSPVER